MSAGWRRWGAVGMALAGLLLVGDGLLRLAGLAARPLTFDVGPSTGGYLSGFTESEERPPLSFRWTRRRAEIRLPLVGEGEARLRIRGARFLDDPVAVQVSIAGRPAGRFSVEPGGFHVHELHVRLEGPLRLEFRAETASATDLGLAVDWIRLEGARFRPSPRLPWPRLLVGGVFLLSLFLGFRLPGALANGAVVAVLAAAAAAWDPFAFVHVTSRIAGPGLGLAALAGAFLRRREAGKWVALIFLAGYLLKGAGVFHPSYFYPDVRLFGRYAMTLSRAPGNLVERGLAAQLQHNTAYPRYVRGRAYAFPYSPVFFLPFSWLSSQRARVEEALKQVALAAGAAEVLAVFLLATAVLGRGSGLMAALLAAFLPPLFSRLLLAMYATIGGHLLDTLLIVAAVGAALRPEAGRRFLALCALAVASLLTYVSSLFTVSGFLAGLALLERRLTRRALALLLGGVATTVLLLYLPFTLVFLTEIGPRLLEPATPGQLSSPSSGGLEALARIPLFYGYLYPALALIGLIVIKKRAPPAAARVVLAYGLTFLGLLSLRAFGGGLFGDLKEITFVGPFIALTAGASLETLAARGRTGCWTAWLLVLSLVGFGLWRYHGYFEPVSRLIGLP